MRTETLPPSDVSLAERDDIGKLLLRVVLALLLLFHGISKLTGGIGFVAGALDKMGLPAAVGYLVYIGEVIAPLMMLFGVWTRVAALVVAGNMVVAVLLVHLPEFFSISPTGGWTLELQAMYLVAAIALMIFGAGRYSIGGRYGTWN